MCRMMAIFGPKETTIPREYLKCFVKNARWGNWRVQDFLGHHRLGWGLAWVDPKTEKLRVKRSLQPIWNSAWEQISGVSSRMIVLHARNGMPWKRDFHDVHPITLDSRHFLTHNGIIGLESFPEPSLALMEPFQETGLDSRRYLISLVEQIQKGLSPTEAFQAVLPDLKLKPSANAFLFTSQDLYMVAYYRPKIYQKYLYTLWYTRLPGGHQLVTSFPTGEQSLRLPNGSCLHFNLSTNSLSTQILS